MSGTYYLSLSLISEEDGVLESNVLNNYNYEFEILDYSNESYGIESSISEDGTNEDKVQIIAQGEESTKQIDLKYNDTTLEDTSVKVTVLKRTGAFTYEEIDANEGITLSTYEISYADLSDNEETIYAYFNKNVDTGTYRIMLTLYNANGYEISECYESFIVY